MMNSTVIDWLLEEGQPSIRYLTLTELLGKSKQDSEVKSARENITKIGWAKEILDKQLPSGYWIGEKSFWNPNFVASNWMLLILSDLGLTKEEPGIERACQIWMKEFAAKDGGFTAFTKKRGHLCITGNTARALIKFGYADHPKVRRAFQWFVTNQSKLGGWSCWDFDGRHKGRNLDSWEPLSAFAVYPRQKWTRSMKEACEKASEFYLQRELHKQGDRYEPWYRFHYPVHYYYDLLLGLDFMTALGYSNDKRLGFAISLLKEKRRKDGKWNLDAIRPESKPTFSGRSKRPNFVPFALEKPGKPSKMITLTALKVLGRIGEA